MWLLVRWGLRNGLGLGFSTWLLLASQEVRICYGEMATVTWNIRGGLPQTGRPKGNVILEPLICRGPAVRFREDQIFQAQGKSDIPSIVVMDFCSLFHPKNMGAG